MSNEYSIYNPNMPEPQDEAAETHELVSYSDESYSDAMRDIRSRCDEINTIANQAAAQTDKVLTEFSGIKERVTQSVKSVEKSDAILKYTQSTTTQMTLLGFNASIEAKRVGAAGEGFNVIAQEVRKLAEQTSLQTADIESVLTEIKQAIKGIETEINSAFANLDKNARTIQELTLKVSETMTQLDK